MAAATVLHCDHSVVDLAIGNRGRRVALALSPGDETVYSFGWISKNFLRPNDTLVLVTFVSEDFDDKPAVEVLTHYALQCRELHIHSVQVKLNCFDAPAVPALLQLIDLHHVEVLVMGSTDKNTLERFVFGSITEDAVHSAQIPMIICKRPKIQHGVFESEAQHLEKRTVLFACDMNQCTELAFLWAAEHFLQTTDQLVLLHVRKDAEKDYESFGLEKFSELCRQREIPFRRENVAVSKKGVGASVMEASKNFQADVILMGSRNRNMAKRALFGSVGDYALHHAHCPVIIVKRPKTGKEGEIVLEEEEPLTGGAI
eukprot:TRINITY_DN2244_c0_g1::TRINITY_DN2244_c0_g1_i1::g.6874::m.6874 TRINITY_DN2244_c0_g1::TRINITY_DN2244_c0_g1_i1::g.6874  ORF type:complete len:315 (+),score=99.03,sp/Q57951/Y531_METJA/41.07/7e-07,Usp/PF00582.21/1.1e-09,Usp/PF00582.21/1.2e-18,Imm37/PF15598.1/15,Imm37/PF15598.1/9.5 TRINITY_DN2244_c0_g1_i1:93-1037(+)